MRPHLVHAIEAVFPTGFAQVIAPSWFTCVGLAGIVTLYSMLAIARRHRIDPGVVTEIVLGCYVAAVAAGIVVPMAIDATAQLFATGHIRVRWAGMTSFWGYLAGAAAVAAVCRARGLPLARLGDLAAAPLGVALALARLGCFLGGCDYGKVSSVGWALRFPSGSPAWQDHVRAGLISTDRAASLPVHPTQLYEAALGLVLFVVAHAVARGRWARRRDGRTFVTTAAMYAIGRMAIEELRGDAGRGIYLGWSSGQIFCVAVLATIGLGWLLRRACAPSIAIAAALVLAWSSARPAHAQPRSIPGRLPAASTPAARSLPAPHRTSSQAVPARVLQLQPAPDDPYGDPDAPSTAPPPAAPADANTWRGEPPAALPAAAMPIQPPAADQTASASRGSALHVGALVGLATPINRRHDQVAMLGGASVSLGFDRRGLGIWLDLDSFANTDASHGTALLSGSFDAMVANHLQVGGRLGLGATLVNFDDPAFRDVAGTTVRFEAVAAYSLGDSWEIWLRPLSFDLLSAAALGGPILTWQMRLGVGYRIALGHRSAARPPPYPAAPLRFDVP